MIMMILKNTAQLSNIDSIIALKGPFFFVNISTVHLDILGIIHNLRLIADIE